MTFTEGMEHVATFFEVLGAAVLVLGLFLSVTLSVRVWWRVREGRVAYQTLRRTFGGVLLLGLEVLVAADLVRTVAVEPTVQNVAVLGLIVLIRTVLSFSLEIEIEGVPPWRRALVGGDGICPRRSPEPELRRGSDSPSSTAAYAAFAAPSSSSWVSSSIIAS